MPIVKINMQKGFSPEYKKTVLDCVHSGIMETLGTEDWDRFQRILEYEPEDFEKPEEKTDHFMIIEITLFPGRTKEQKKRIIEIVTSKLVTNFLLNRRISSSFFPIRRWKTGAWQESRNKIICG